MTDSRLPDTEALVRIVDDDTVLTDALAFMLQCEGWKVRTYPNAAAFLADDAPSVLGVLILDHQMPGMSGAELQFELERRGSRLPIVFLTAHGDVDLAVQTLRRGAYHFLQKPVDAEVFLTTIAEAAEADRRRRGAIPDAREASEKLEQLTSRERQVINLLGKGLLNKQIAERLGLSVRTVEVYRASAYRKLGVRSVAEIARILQAVEP